MTKISPARVAAYEILRKIETERAFSSVLLPLYEANLEAKDRALCHEITLGVLRNQIYLDALAEKLTNKKKLDAEVKIILRIALYQLIFLDKIPAHAAINEAVNQTRAAKKTSAKNLVNAVLRRFTREKPQLTYADEIEKLAVETSHPRWLLEKWIGQFGFAETAALARADNETPALDFRFTAKTTDAVKQSLADENSKPDKNYLRDLAAGGKIYFQDAASQIIADAVNLQAGESFLDVCCAPGSKFTLINYRAKPVEKLFVGGDFYRQRIDFVRENCVRTGARNYDLAIYDAEKSMPFADFSFDVALLDAPCSGTGTIRHNPEIRYFLEPDDILILSAKQLRILENASKLIKPGGRLIYSTCSLEIEENESVVESFLAANADFVRQTPEVPEKFITGGKFARTFPPRDNMDGFFVARLVRRGV